MTEYSRLAKGTFTSTGLPQYINLPFQPDYVEFLNVTINATPRDNGIVSATWDANDGQGTAEVSLFNGTGVYTTDSVAVNGISTFAAGTLLQYGPTQQVVSSTKGGLLTTFTVTAHGYATGDVVVFEGLYQTPTTGMPQMAGMMFRIEGVTANTFEVPWSTSGSNYTALSGSPVGAVVKKVLYPYLYVPSVSYVAGLVTNGSGPGTTQVITTTSNNFVVGQEIAFRFPPQWGATSFNSLPNNLIPGSPVYAYVQAIVNDNTFVIKTNPAFVNNYNSNVPVGSVPGLSFPQVLAVGDINSGGTPYSGGALYPSPLVRGFPTINGPAISGAFINNTSQGFIIGSGTAVTDTTAILVGGSGDTIRWRAFLHDYSSP
jgi:hypothetical protein